MTYETGLTMIIKIEAFPIVPFRAFSYGQMVSRLTRKRFDKFTSEISSLYENNMKSYTAFI
jgi:hypothetical protein